MTARLCWSVWRIALVSAFLVGAAPATAYAQAQDDAFKKGMDALKDKKWPDAAAALQRAVEIDPKEASRKVGRRIGFGGDEYLPYFHLGEALFATGDCAGAITAWEQSDRQAVARKIGNNGRVVLAGYTQCEAKGFLLEARLAKEVQDSMALYRASNELYQEWQQYRKAHPGVSFDAAAEATAQTQIAAAYERLASGQRTRRAQDFMEVRTLLGSADRTIRTARELLTAAVAAGEKFNQRVKDVENVLQEAETEMRDFDSALASTTPLKVTPSDAVNAAHASAGAQLAGARSKLQSGRLTQADADLTDAARIAREATALIGRARTQFESEVSAAIGTEFENLQLRTASLVEQIDQKVRTIEEKLRQHPEGGGASAELTKLQTGLARARRSIDRSVKARDLANAQAAAATLAELGPQLDILAVRLGLAATPDVPAALWNAALALRDGRYADVLSALSLDEAGSILMPLRVYAHAIRSAALFALYEHSGESDDTLRRRAREEADIGRSLDPAFRPSTAFSPRFINFFLAAPQAAR